MQVWKFIKKGLSVLFFAKTKKNRLKGGGKMYVSGVKQEYNGFGNILIGRIRQRIGALIM